MPEPNTNQEANEPMGNEPANEGGSTYTPPATQADLDRIIENRLQRERAKYADYDTYKAEAGKVSELVAERDDLRSQLEAANAEVDAFKAKEQKSEWAKEVSEETGVPVEALRGETKEEMEEHAKTLERYLKHGAPYVPSDGKKPNASAGTSARDLFAQALEGVI